MTQRGWVRGSWQGRFAAAGFALTVGAPLVAIAPSSAASAPAVTRISVRIAPATVRVGATLVASGSVTPRVTGAPVVLQRLVGRRWVSLRSARVSANGAFSISVRTPARPAVWQLRVARARSTAALAGASRTLGVRVTTSVFTVRAAAAAATVPSGDAVVVTGSVTPRAPGIVRLQRLQGGVWRNVTTASLTGGSTYRFSRVLGAGVHRLRVHRPFTSRVADGVSRTLAVTVLAAPTPLPTPTPTATPPATVTLARGTVGRLYAAGLSATGTTASSIWTATGPLPAGLALTSDGRLWGYPTAAGSTTIPVTITGAGAGTATFAVTIGAAPSGVVRAWGDNSSGQLGKGTTGGVSSVPVAVSNLTRVTSVAGGLNTGYALRFDGTVWAWGANSNLQRGDADPAKRNVPAAIAGLTDVTAIAAGNTAAYALLSNGTVRAWGNNRVGELGNGSTTTISASPVHVTGPGGADLKGVFAIAASSVNAYALRNDGTVWAWGSNARQGLGNGSSVTFSRVPVQVTGLKGIIAIDAGGSTAYALRADGTVWAWGDNTTSQLGAAPGGVSGAAVQVGELSGVTAIAAHNGGAYARLSDTTVRAWGDNAQAQFGNTSTVPSSSPVTVTGLTGVTVLGGGGQGGYAIVASRTGTTAGGGVRAWGVNTKGQLGNGNQDASLVPVAVTGLTGALAITGTFDTAYAVVTPPLVIAP